MNINFQNVLNKTPQKIPPVWCMRQAGRYQKSYQKIRTKYSFKEICKTPELAAEVACNAIKEFGFDLAILFSDILFPLESLGFSLEYAESGAPGVLPILKSKEDFPTKKELEETKEFLSFQILALQATKDILPQNKSLIGFIGGPYTLFSFATGHAENFDGDLFTFFSNKLLPVLRASIIEQLNNGAELVYIFDTLAAKLNSADYARFVIPELIELTKDYEDKIAYYIKTDKPDIFYLSPLSRLKGLILPAAIPITTFLNHESFVQGNFNEKFLLLDQAILKIEMIKYFLPIKDLPQEKRANWICSLGHGILKDTPETNVKFFVDFMHEFFY